MRSLNFGVRGAGEADLDKRTNAHLSRICSGAPFTNKNFEPLLGCDRGEEELRVVRTGDADAGPSPFCTNTDIDFLSRENSNVAI